MVCYRLLMHHVEREPQGPQVTFYLYPPQTFARQVFEQQDVRAAPQQGAFADRHLFGECTFESVVVIVAGIFG